MKKLIQYCTEASKKEEFSLANWLPAAGMAYVLVTEHDHFIVIDGGEFLADAEGLVALMEEIAHGKPVVDLWIMTHLHPDHFGALRALSQSRALLDRVAIKALCYNSTDKISDHGPDNVQIMREIVDGIGCERITPHTDDVLEIDGTAIRFFFTWEDLPENFFEQRRSQNELSMIFTVSGREKRVMFTGDSTTFGPNMVAKKYAPEDLRSDIIQLPHHGLDGGDIQFFKTVDAATVLIPCTVGGARFMRNPETIANVRNEYAQNRAWNVLYACLGTVALDV